MAVSQKSQAKLRGPLETCASDHLFDFLEDFADVSEEAMARDWKRIKSQPALLRLRAQVGGTALP
jgi:hypothetical protein